MTSYACSVNQLVKVIKGNVIIDDVSFKIPQGRITSILGSNGAGKTTIMKLILGTIKPTSGEIILFDEVIEEKEGRKKLSYVPEHLEFPSHSTPKHFLRYHCVLNGFTFNEATPFIKSLAKTLKFTDFLNQRFSTLSAGMTQKIRFALGFTRKNPQFILLDEPLANLDILTRDFFLEFLRTKIAENETTLFYSSHILSEVKQLSHHLLLLSKGRFVEEYDLEGLLQKKKSYYYRLLVDNPTKAQEIFTAEGITFSTEDSQFGERTLVVLLNETKEANDIIDLLRRQEIGIYSWSEDPYFEPLHKMKEIMQNE